ncbi:MAG: tripartite tricarboxylate transporter TctB family protein [Rhodospirillales bacterium]
MDTRLSRIVIASAVCLLAAAGLFWLIPAQTGEARAASDISPAFFPNLSLGICLLLGLFLVREAVGGRRKPQKAASAEEEAADDDTLSGRALITDMAIWIAGAVATMLLLKFAGFIPTGIVLLAGWMAFCGRRFSSGWWRSRPRCCSSA